MMKLSKITLALAVSVAITGCATDDNKMSNDGSLEQVQADYQTYEEITNQYQINEEWWTGYRDSQLNSLVDRALANNLDLAKSAITVNKALYNANLLGADLVPSFSGSGSSSASKGAGDPSKNSRSTGTSVISHSLGVNLSYTLDLWNRLADAQSAAEWTHEATKEDLAATKLALVNSVVNTYYNLAYLNEAIKIRQNNIANYQKISKVMNNKFSVGVVDKLSVDQAMQAILQEQNNLIALKTARNTAEQTMRNLLNLKPSAALGLRYPNVLNVRLQGVNLNVPVSSIANRPDLKAALFRLQSGFKSLKAMENSWYPTVTLGASLTGTASAVGDVPLSPVGAGSVSFNLPFLDWNRVENNIKLSEEDYKLAKLNYEQTATSALNEISTYYYTYSQSKNSLSNLQKTYKYNKKISTYYKNRYDQGVAELRDWLNAINTENASKLAIVQAKYSTLQYENLVYQAMAGKYR